MLPLVSLTPRVRDLHVVLPGKDSIAVDKDTVGADQREVVQVAGCYRVLSGRAFERERRLPLSAYDITLIVPERAGQFKAVCREVENRAPVVQSDLIGYQQKVGFQEQEMPQRFFQPQRRVVGRGQVSQDVSVIPGVARFDDPGHVAVADRLCCSEPVLLTSQLPDSLH